MRDSLVPVTRCRIMHMLTSGRGERPSCPTLRYGVAAVLLTRRSVGHVEKSAQETGGSKGEGNFFFCSVFKDRIALDILCC